ncbi:membrane protein [Arenimonas soli]|uniref:Membrane protein n=1 Tax=Arenimonas soli TaxID=2269504 RepID=A0ABQ1HPC4_9GAMM|nr:OmpW family outer membrane protein [Arenimonas soli]GGA84103.1 membrane protein [Arenimonas soli]
MQRLVLTSFALAAALVASGANAQAFSLTLGYQNTDPKSDNDQLAGADATVNDDWSLTGSAAYAFNDSWSVELWSGLARFEHEVSLAGLGTVASVEHRPTTLSVNYHFAPDSPVRPFIGLGYGWVNVSGERTLGALSGLGIDGSNANGIAFGAGLDWFVNDRFFLRADVRRLSFETDVTVETLGNVGTAEVDPIVYGISAGLRF